MIRNFFERGRKMIVEPQSSVLSGALVIMGMVILSQIFGVIRQRVILSYFPDTDYALFLAAFRLPDIVLEILAVGVFSSAFIPVFTRELKKEERVAWDTAARVVNIGIVLFLPIALLFGLFAKEIYGVITPGFTEQQGQVVANLARILFAAQGFFVVSYVITGVLESSQRFFVSALAPLVYNLGIIIGTILLSPTLGLYAPAVGVLFGAFGHLLVQLPLAMQLGFRFKPVIKPSDDVRKVGRLAAPRMIELSILQIQKTAELSFASLLSVASYTYLNLANSLQVVPITLFGVSLAKAALPALTREADDPKRYKHILLTTLYQMMFFIVPIATILIVLRVPIVRLVYGTDRFDWDATVTTGLVLTGYAIGIPMQAALTLISRAFYALHDTKTPVSFAIFDVFLTIAIQVVCIFVLHLPVWSIAFANSLSCLIQISLLYYVLSKKLHDGTFFSLLPIFKSIAGGIAAGSVMFILLKTFDRSAWVKRISFINSIDALKNLNFEHFVLDTRYTFNLIVLTIITALIGMIVYVIVLALLRSGELALFVKLVRGRAFKLLEKEQEPLTPSPME